MLWFEVARLCALQIHDPDEAVLGNQRHRELGADVRIGADVVLFAGDIVKKHG